MAPKDAAWENTAHPESLLSFLNDQSEDVGAVQFKRIAIGLSTQRKRPSTDASLQMLSDSHTLLPEGYRYAEVEHGYKDTYKSICRARATRTSSTHKPWVSPTRRKDMNARR